MENFLIFEEKSHSRDNTKYLKKIPTYRLGFVGPCDRKHNFFGPNLTHTKDHFLLLSAIIN